MKIEKIKKEKLVMLKENLKEMKDPRQKGKTTVVVILAVLSDYNKWAEIEDFAKDKKIFEGVLSNLEKS